VIDVHDLVRELAGTTCRCGRAKKARMTLCAHCYHLLPPPLRSALYRRIGEGYEEAVEAAVTALGLEPTR
jgi:hypothetical protein